MRKFFKTVALVTVFSISEKFLGFLYRIYLSRTIGAEGIGLYQVALSIFALLLTLSCSGVPITVSRLMTKYRAENREDKVQKVISAGLLFTILVVLPVMAVFFIFTDKFTFLFADKRCVNIFLVVLPGLIFTSIYSVLRGVFWGDKDFLPYSIIELLEEICMIVVGIILINSATEVYQGAFRAGVAVLCSYIFSFTVAFTVFFIRKHKFKNPKSEFKPLLSSAVPITAMRSANSLTSSLVSIILPIRLVQVGLSSNMAMASFGSLMGQALPLLYIPTTLIGSFILVLVPEISENFYKKNYFYLKRDIEKSIKFTSLLTCVFTPIFLVCGKEIGVLVFSSHECGTYLTFCAFLMFFMSLSSITTSMLNSIGLENKTLFYYIIGGLLMLLCIWFLPKAFGIYSLVFGFFALYGLTTFLNLKLLNKNCVKKPKYKKFLSSSLLLVLPTALFGMIIKKLVLSFLGSFLTLIICSVLMAVFYLLLCVGFNLVSTEFISRNFAYKLKRKKTKINKV